MSEIPDHIAVTYAGWSTEVAWSYNDVPTTWRLTHADGRVRYLKVRASNDIITLRREAATTRWLGQYLRTPPVVDDGSRDGVDWLITDAIAGRDATNPEWCAKPDWIVPVFARGLRRVHDTVPIDGCPFRLTPDDAIAMCRANIDNDLVTDAWLHDDHKPLGIEGAFAEMQRLRPATEDLVVCHGDYCFPNVLIEDGQVTGYLDLGELNVADRWCDLAIGMWTTTWNCGPGYEELFAESYGVEVDDDRLLFWRLAYSFMS